MDINSFDYKEFTPQELNAFLTIDSLDEMMDFANNFRRIVRDLPKDYIIRLLNNENLDFEEKISLGLVLVIKSGFHHSSTLFFELLIIQLVSDEVSVDNKILIRKVLLFVFLFVIESLIFDRKLIISTTKGSKDVSNAGIRSFFGTIKANEQLVNRLEMLSENIKEIEISVKKLLSQNFSLDKKELNEFLLLDLITSVAWNSQKLLNQFFFVVFWTYKDLTAVIFDVLDIIRRRINKNTRTVLLLAIFDAMSYDSEYIDSAVAELIEPFVSSSRYQIRLNAAITQWLVSGEVLYIQKAKETASSVKENEILGEILDDPVGQKSKFARDRSKKIDEIVDKWMEVSAPEERIDDPKKIYLFSIGGSQRLAAIRGSDTLDWLHEIIYGYMDFEPMHSYGFFLNNKAWSRSFAYWHPEIDKPSAGSVKIHELGFYLGQKILYIYDFGDNFRVRLTLEAVVDPKELPSEVKTNLPDVISSKHLAK